MTTDSDAPRDEVFRDEKDFVADFKFGAEVANVFDDMVSRSVPFYSEVQRLQTELATQFLPDGPSMVVDLGCSTGTTIAGIASHPATGPLRPHPSSHPSTPCPQFHIYASGHA